MTTRTFFVGGNHKCNGNKASIKALVSELNKVESKSNVEIIIAPPSIYLDYTQSLVDSGKIQLSAQNCYSETKGAFTGEIAAEMVKDLNINWVIIGHSERRSIFGESGELLAKKTKHAIDIGLKVIFCIGEQLADRQSSKTEAVLSAQLGDLKSLDKKQWDSIVIAYEPVWAIGTGVTATPDQAQDTHKYVRSWLKDNIDETVAAKTSIMYGGSVGAANCNALAEKPDVDGFLVGGASLIATDFSTIIKSASPKTI
ncbi:hypothetical protein CYY_002164 [Polysphondylium violaceum]|uniref:Triosephosphate isomerase n=1 Tax=Polysphondylium violaceum TaxID=133409 RepID=A0A8J4PZW5_9MYCE|nr:hypothetical protein CYY_002164 [Polysphondylium violaceum]